jgi:hypothetical protein
MVVWEAQSIVQHVCTQHTLQLQQLLQSRLWSASMMPRHSHLISSMTPLSRKRSL